MRQSQLFTKTLKDAPKDEVSHNAQLLIRAGFIDKVFAGVYTILPLGLRVLYRIEDIVRQELNGIGAQELLMPALHPLENYKKTQRDAIDVLFFTELRDGKKLTLGQSHEEIVTPLLSKYIQSYKDLPSAVYQFQTKFRNELRSKSGIMRGREFRMKDLYSFHTNQNDLDEYYEVIEQTYARIFDRLGIHAIKTYASGGTFSQYSHEYQTVTNAGEDTIYTCKDCTVAVNKEIIDELQSACPECGSTSLMENKAIEVANIFKLGDRFSSAFEFTYADENGSYQPVIMGCYGLGITRVLGTIAEMHNDEFGLCWPASVSPYDVHLVSLCNQDTDIDQANTIYERLLEEGVDVLYDDRADVRAGNKFADSDLIGIPVRLVVSAKTLSDGRVEQKKRGEQNTSSILIEGITKKLII